VANSIAWQFHPRGTHRVGLFSLDFLWFFLVSRQERTCEMALRHAFHLRCNTSPLLLVKGIASIAIDVGLSLVFSTSDYST